MIQCTKCGEHMIGDGYNTPYHCPNTDADGLEPDAGPKECSTRNIRLEVLRLIAYYPTREEVETYCPWVHKEDLADVMSLDLGSVELLLLGLKTEGKIKLGYAEDLAILTDAGLDEVFTD